MSVQNMTKDETDLMAIADGICAARADGNLLDEEKEKLAEAIDMGQVFIGQCNPTSEDVLKKDWETRVKKWERKLNA